MTNDLGILDESLKDNISKLLKQYYINFLLEIHVVDINQRKRPNLQHDKSYYIKDGVVYSTKTDFSFCVKSFENLKTRNCWTL